MSVIDPRLAVILGAGGVIVGSPEIRTVIGRGAGYVARGVMAVAAPVVRPMLHAGEEIVDEARHTATATATGAATGTATGDQAAQPAASTRRAKPAAS